MSKDKMWAEFKKPMDTLYTMQVDLNVGWQLLAADFFTGSADFDKSADEYLGTLTKLIVAGETAHAALANLKAFMKSRQASGTS
jgi:hypothetical protein